MSSPVRTSLAKPSQICGRSSIALAAIPVSAFVGIGGPPRGGRDQQQWGKSDRQRDRAGEEQRGLGSDGADEHAAEREGGELGAVAGGVVEREAAPAQRLRHAL